MTATVTSSAPVTTGNALVPVPPPASKTVEKDEPDRLERLRTLEQVVDRSLDTFVEIGNALRQINDEGLYKLSEFGEECTFQFYVAQRFGFSRQHAYRLINEAKIQELLSPTGDMLPSERVARALVPLKKDPDQLQQVWSNVRKHGKALTAEIVTAEVRKVRPETKSERPSNSPNEQQREGRIKKMIRKLAVADPEILERVIRFCEELRDELHSGNTDEVAAA